LNQTIFGNWLQDTWICWRSSKNWEILRHQTTKMVNFITCVFHICSGTQTNMYVFLSFFIHIYIYWLCICSYINIHTQAIDFHVVVERRT
jgi:hypothetical protein